MYYLRCNLATEKSRTNWHLINVRQPSTQQYVMKYVKKGFRVFVGGRIEYLRSQDEQGHTKDLAVVISGKKLMFKCYIHYTCISWYCKYFVLQPARIVII